MSLTAKQVNDYKAKKRTLAAMLETLKGSKVTADDLVELRIVKGRLRARFLTTCFIEVSRPLIHEEAQR